MTKCNAVLDMSNSLQLPSCQVARIQEQEHKKWCMFIRYACSLLYSFIISMNFRCFVIFAIIAWYASRGFTFLRQGELPYLLRQIALCWLWSHENEGIGGAVHHLKTNPFSDKHYHEYLSNYNGFPLVFYRKIHAHQSLVVSFVNVLVIQLVGI